MLPFNHHNYFNFRLFLRAATPDTFSLLLAQCIASLLEDGKTVPHTGLPLRVLVGIDKLKGLKSSVDDKNYSSYSNIQPTVNSSDEGEGVGDGPSDMKSADRSPTVSFNFTVSADPASQCIADPLLSWKKLAALSGIRLRPNSFSRQDKTFQSFCSNLLALSYPLRSRVNSNSNFHGMKNSDIMSQDAHKREKTYSEIGGFILSKEKWEEINKVFLKLKNIKISNEKKGLSSGSSKFQWTMDLLFRYIERVVRDGEILYSTGDSIQGEGRSGRECTLIYIELASLVYCRNNLNEILPYVRDIEDRSSVRTSYRDTGSNNALSTLLSHDPFPPTLTRLLLSYTDLIAEATASGTMSQSCTAARTIGCAPFHTVIGGRRLPIDADALAVLDACVQKIASSSSTGSYSHSQLSNCIEHTPGDLCKDDDIIKLKSLEELSMTLFSLARAGKWEAATLILKRFASGILSNSGSRIHHSHLNPFQSCHVEFGGNVLEALQSCAAYVTPFAPSSTSISPPSGAMQPSPKPKGAGSYTTKDDILANYTDFAAHSKLYGLCSLHYAAVEGNFHFIQTALDLFETAVIPVRLIIDIMLLTQLNKGNMKEKENENENEIPTILLMNLVSRADLDPRSMPTEDFFNNFIRENESQLYRAAMQSIYAAYTIAENHNNPIDCYDNKSMGLICPQYAGQLRGLCLRMGPHNNTIYSDTASKQYLHDQHVRTPKAEHPLLGSEDSSPYRSTATYVCMMDGSSLSLQDFFSDINNLYKALPAPEVALGSGHTGDTLLHEAAKCTDPGLVNMLFKDLTCVNSATAAIPPSDNSETHANTLKSLIVLKSSHSCGTAFTMNQDGATPIYLALLNGHVATINDALVRSVERPLSTNQNNSLLRNDHAKDLIEVTSNRADKIQSQSRDVSCKSGLTMGSISYRDTLLSLMDLSGLRACADPRSPHTSPHTRTNISSLFINSANQRVDKAEKELMKITKISLPMEASVDVLKL